MVGDVFTCMCRDFSRDKIIVDIQIPDGFTLWAVPVLMQQVLMNLILNARDAMLPKGGRLTIKAADSGDAVTIEVADTGCGIAAENIGRIFEPFFSTKTLDSSHGQTGAGMGLAFCKHIVNTHNGNITASSRVGEETSFIITLPKSECKCGGLCYSEWSVPGSGNILFNEVIAAVSIIANNLWHIIAMLFLLAASAFFSATETAFFSLTRRQLTVMSQSKHRLGRLVAAMLTNPKNLLAGHSARQYGGQHLFFFACKRSYFFSRPSKRAAAVAAITGFLAFAICHLWAN